VPSANRHKRSDDRPTSHEHQGSPSGDWPIDRASARSDAQESAVREIGHQPAENCARTLPRKLVRLQLAEIDNGSEKRIRVIPQARVVAVSPVVRKISNVNKIRKISRLDLVKSTRPCK
jgi:hypothetical protein